MGYILPTCSIFFSTLLFVIFFFKKRISLLENKVYSYMIVCTLFTSIIEAFLQYITLDGVGSIDYFFANILNRFTFILLINYLFFLFIYLLLISNSKSEVFLRRFQYLIIILKTVVIALIILLHIDTIEENGAFSVSGSAVNLTYIICFLYFIGSFIITILNVKKLDKRYIPVYAVFFILVLIFILFRINPYIIIISIALTFVNYIMYFTIENPDVKMLEELAKNKKIIENQQEDITNFLFRITQDIRQPIKDLLEQSKEQYIDSKYVNSKMRELDFIVNDILDVSGLSTGSLKVYDNKYDIYVLMKEVKTKTEMNLPQKIKLEYYMSRNIPRVLYGDQIMLRKVILSLLANAIKHTKEGYVSLEVDALVKYDVSRIIISVSDTGIGMGLDKINQIMSHEISEDQYKIDSEKQLLNLNDIKHVLPALDGTMVIKSEEGFGTTVSITINEKIAETKEREIVKKIEMYEESLKQNKKVMVVDDDAVELSKIKRIIENKVNNCSSSLFGIDVVENVSKNHKYDLIILDDETDTYSAYEILKELKKIEGFNIPVVIMIEDNKEFIKLHFLKDGFSDVILKSKLTQEIERVLDKNY